MRLRIGSRQSPQSLNFLKVFLCLTVVAQLAIPTAHAADTREVDVKIPFPTGDIKCKGVINVKTKELVSLKCPKDSNDVSGPSKEIVIK